jgi:RHS repeat-associated protein
MMPFNNGISGILESKTLGWHYAHGTLPTDFTYTGQRSEMDSIGLMFYTARWYDPQLGRFAQADSIVPGGVQGLDRYAYANNNALRYNDPSGHYCEGIQQGDAYNACMTASYGSQKPPSLTPNGQKMYETYYIQYSGVDGWWNADGDFTLEDFVGMWILFESTAAWVDTWLKQGEKIASAVAQNLFVGGWNVSTGVNPNAVFNFMGAWKDGKSGITKGPEKIKNYARDSGLDDAQAKMKEWGMAALHPKTLNWDRNDAPSNWGNINGAKDINVPRRNFGSASNSVYYKNSSFVVLSVNQYNYWALRVDMTFTHLAQ